jgi:hypothetical protein
MLQNRIVTEGCSPVRGLGREKSEDAFKSELRSKEAEIAALRDGILSGRMQRQALLDKRPMEAVEKV